VYLVLLSFARKTAKPRVLKRPFASALAVTSTTYRCLLLPIVNTTLKIVVRTWYAVCYQVQGEWKVGAKRRCGHKRGKCWINVLQLGYYDTCNIPETGDTTIFCMGKRRFSGWRSTWYKSQFPPSPWTLRRQNTSVCKIDDIILWSTQQIEIQIHVNLYTF